MRSQNKAKNNKQQQQQQLSISRTAQEIPYGMHSQETKQPCMRSARKNRTRKKSAVEEDPRKNSEKNKKNEPFE